MTEETIHVSRRNAEIQHAIEEAVRSWLRNELAAVDPAVSQVTIVLDGVFAWLRGPVQDHLGSLGFDSNFVSSWDEEVCSTWAIHVNRRATQ